jgi:hypothetical protein
MRRLLPSLGPQHRARYRRLIRSRAARWQGRAADRPANVPLAGVFNGVMSKPHIDADADRPLEGEAPPPRR